MFSTTRRSNPSRVPWGYRRVDLQMDPGYISMGCSLPNSCQLIYTFNNNNNIPLVIADKDLC